jgi:hypothetical protein
LRGDWYLVAQQPLIRFTMTGISPRSGVWYFAAQRRLVFRRAAASGISPRSGVWYFAAQWRLVFRRAVASGISPRSGGVV